MRPCGVMLLILIPYVLIEFLCPPVALCLCFPRPWDVSIHYAVVFESPSQLKEPGAVGADSLTKIALRELVAKALTEDTSLPVYDVHSLTFGSGKALTH